MNKKLLLLSAILGISAYGCSIDEPLGDSCGGKTGEFVILLPSGIICPNDSEDSGECSSYNTALSAHACPAEFYCHNSEEEVNAEVSSMVSPFYCSKKPNCSGNTHFNGQTGVCENDTDNACGAVDINCKNYNTDWIDGICVEKHCIPAKCKDGMHKENEKCQPDTVEKCGDALMDCSIENKICQAGKCEYNIVCSETVCGGVCIDTSTSRQHCGRCGNECSGNMECINSTCGCSNNKTECNLNCVDLQTDLYNCGHCGNRCADTQTCENAQCVGHAVGDVFFMGHYEQDNDTSNGKEPIKWIILDINNAGQSLVISEMALDVKPYNKTSVSMTWENSTIRSWLNGYGASSNTDAVNYTSDSFISAAFTSDEQKRIIQSKVIAEKNPRYGAPNPGNDTNDKIFLLSLSEAEKFFTSAKARQVNSTRYVVKHGASVLGSESGGTYTDDGSCADTHCYSSWWLRTSGDSSRTAATVAREGSISTSGQFIESSIFTVRPVMWVQL